MAGRVPGIVARHLAPGVHRPVIVAGAEQVPCGQDLGDQAGGGIVGFFRQSHMPQIGRWSLSQARRSHIATSCSTCGVTASITLA